MSSVFSHTCSPQKLRLPRRWPQHCSGPSAHCLYAVHSVARDGWVNEAEAIERLLRSPHWVWTASDPESDLLLSVQGGDCTLAMAQAVLYQLARLLAPRCVPFFLSDGYPHYLSAIVTHFGHWVQQPRRL